MTYIELILKGIISGILTAFLLVYGLRPSVPYPDIILEPFEHNWLFIILFVINYYLLLWDLKIGVLMLLSILALLFDLFVFTYNGIEKKYTIINNSPITSSNPIEFIKNIYISEPSTTEKNNNSSTDTYINNNIYELKTLKDNTNKTDLIPGEPASFI